MKDNIFSRSFSQNNIFKLFPKSQKITDFSIEQEKCYS